MRPKTELTPDLIDLHASLRSKGVPIAEACRIAGHSVGVWYRWKAEAEAQQARDEKARKLIARVRREGPIEVSKDELVDVADLIWSNRFQ